MSVLKAINYIFDRIFNIVRCSFCKKPLQVFKVSKKSREFSDRKFHFGICNDCNCKFIYTNYWFCYEEKRLYFNDESLKNIAVYINEFDLPYTEDPEQCKQDTCIRYFVVEKGRHTRLEDWEYVYFDSLGRHSETKYLFELGYDVFSKPIDFLEKKIKTTLCFK